MRWLQSLWEKQSGSSGAKGLVRCYTAFLIALLNIQISVLGSEEFLGVILGIRTSTVLDGRV